jgi:hypothetical protein
VTTGEATDADTWATHLPQFYPLEDRGPLRGLHFCVTSCAAELEDVVGSLAALHAADAGNEDR